MKSSKEITELLKPMVGKTVAAVEFVWDDALGDCTVISFTDGSLFTGPTHDWNPPPRVEEKCPECGSLDSVDSLKASGQCNSCKIDYPWPEEGCTGGPVCKNDCKLNELQETINKLTKRLAKLENRRECKCGGQYDDKD